MIMIGMILMTMKNINSDWLQIFRILSGLENGVRVKHEKIY